MKTYVLLISLLLGSWSYAAEDLSIGAIVGSTTGISAKAGLGNNQAVDLALAYSLDSRYGLTLHSDYLFENARQFSVGEVNPLNLYYGLGARFQSIRDGSDKDKTRIGIRAPIGLSYIISNPNIELFGELAPILDLTPSTGFSLDVGIGLRVRF